MGIFIVLEGKVPGTHEFFGGKLNFILIKTLRFHVLRPGTDFEARCIVGNSELI